MTGLIVNHIGKSFNEKTVLTRISFQVGMGEIVAVLGPSGCGKSTLLNIIAGLHQPDHGTITWNGKDLMGIPTHRRGFGLMFQDYALFPHRNVYSNVAFGLQMSSLPANEIKSRVEEVLTLVDLHGFDKRDIHTLSGGEQQRVALARSLAPRPRLLMLDEPLGSLDRTMRERLVVDLKRILRESEQTAIYVTHDQEEAFALADRVVVMQAGCVEQVGAPQDIYRQPTSAFVARFLGMDNIFAGTIKETPEGRVVETPIGVLPINAGSPGPAIVLLRPDSASLVGEGLFQLVGRVHEVSFRGSICRARIHVNDIPLTFDFLSNTRQPGIDERVTLNLDIEKAIQLLER